MPRLNANLLTWSFLIPGELWPKCCFNILPELLLAAVLSPYWLLGFTSRERSTSNAHVSPLTTVRNLCTNSSKFKLKSKPCLCLRYGVLTYLNSVSQLERENCVHETVFKAALNNFSNFAPDPPFLFFFLEQLFYLIASSIPDFSFLGLVNCTSLEWPLRLFWSSQTQFELLLYEWFRKLCR